MKEKIEWWLIITFNRFIYFLLRVLLKFCIRFFSQERLYFLKLQLDEIWNDDEQTVEEWVRDMYKTASEENLYWMWITAETIDKFYDKTSWIETV